VCVCARSHFVVRQCLIICFFSFSRGAIKLGVHKRKPTSKRARTFTRKKGLRDRGRGGI
jgi:hypothetical protein